MKKCILILLAVAALEVLLFCAFPPSDHCLVSPGFDDDSDQPLEHCGLPPIEDGSNKARRAAGKYESDLAREAQWKGQHQTPAKP